MNTIETTTRRELARDNASTFGVRRAFDIEIERLKRRGVRGDRAFGLAAHHLFGRWVR